MKAIVQDWRTARTAKRGQHQGNEKGHTIKTPRRKTSENSQTADAHGTAEITGQSREKSGD